MGRDHSRPRRWRRGKRPLRIGHDQCRRRRRTIVDGRRGAENNFAGGGGRETGGQARGQMPALPTNSRAESGARAARRSATSGWGRAPAAIDPRRDPPPRARRRPCRSLRARRGFGSARRCLRAETPSRATSHGACRPRWTGSCGLTPRRATKTATTTVPRLRAPDTRRCRACEVRAIPLPRARCATRPPSGAAKRCAPARAWTKRCAIALPRPVHGDRARPLHRRASPHDGLPPASRARSPRATPTPDRHRVNRANAAALPPHPRPTAIRRARSSRARRRSMESMPATRPATPRTTARTKANPAGSTTGTGCPPPAQ